MKTSLANAFAVVRLHKSKNFTSDYEIRMPPTVPLNHYSDPKANTIGPKSCDVSHANVSRAWACFEHSNFFKVTAPEARPGQLRPGTHRRQKGWDDRCTPRGGPTDPSQSPTTSFLTATT
ncbi:unnamed protein product [Musa hybrid cultivar]